MKVKGQDLIDFYTEWPPGENVFIEEAPFEKDENGVLCQSEELSWEIGPRVEPSAFYEVDWGHLGWQGEGKPPATFNDDFVIVLRKWLKARITTTLVLEVPKAEKDDAIELLTTRGWKVRS